MNCATLPCGVRADHQYSAHLATRTAMTTKQHGLLTVLDQCSDQLRSVCYICQGRRQWRMFHWISPTTDPQTHYNRKEIKICSKSLNVNKCTGKFNQSNLLTTVEAASLGQLTPWLTHLPPAGMFLLPLWSGWTYIMYAWYCGYLYLSFRLSNLHFS